MHSKVIFYTWDYSRPDNSLFVRISNAGFMFILVYVDDIIVTGSNPITVNEVIASLSSRFSLKDMGNLHYFLGVEVIRSSDDIILSQANYANEILNAEMMSDYKSAKTPMSNSELLKPNDGAQLIDETHYRRVLGKLQYMSFTRPDISYAVNKLSQYLRGTIQFGLRVTPNCDFNMHMYSDADWAGDLTDRSSTSGYILFFDRNPISWSSKKQKTVARTSTETEYRAVANALAELLWIRNLLLEMKLPVRDTPTIYSE
ncbi:PREDICTED: uncharacterized protein LOC109233019 [Nicotiana attenuata]|uniref:uncharacterized protein LOC109233019 n=1 Tax=Nicotiana attenuata TaxID=49451 RepID=UPI000905B0E5|nr:PREDICTED: uncharacterized protein LOC109233019 [Nicotiana attenuata]